MFKEQLVTLLPHSITPTLRLSRTAARLSSPKSCPKKPKLYVADRSSRPRILLRPAEPDYGGQERGTLHKQDVGEVGRTSTNYQS